MHDDRADSYALALQGIIGYSRMGDGYGATVEGESVLHKIPEGVFLGEGEGSGERTRYISGAGEYCLYQARLETPAK